MLQCIDTIGQKINQLQVWRHSKIFSADKRFSQYTYPPKLSKQNYKSWIGNEARTGMGKLQSAGVVEYTDYISAKEWDDPQTNVLIWHYTIWWWDTSNAGALGNVEYLFIAMAPRSTLARNCISLCSLIYGLNRTVRQLNYVKTDNLYWSELLENRTV